MDFGDYVIIEMKRYGVPNEYYTHKVVGVLRSNSYVDVPVQTPATETHHDGLVDVVACVCQGVSERDVRRYRVKDVRLQARESTEKADNNASAPCKGHYWLPTEKDSNTEHCGHCGVERTRRT